MPFVIALQGNGSIFLTQYVVEVVGLTVIEVVVCPVIIFEPIVVPVPH